MAQRGDWSTGEYVSMRVESTSQFRNAQGRMQSVLPKTGGVLPGSVPRVGEQTFNKHRNAEFSNNQQSAAGKSWENLGKKPADQQTRGSFDGYQARNRENLETLKRQLLEKGKNEGKSSCSSPSTVGASFKFSDEATLAPKLPAADMVNSSPAKRTEVKAELLGIIEVKTPLQYLLTDQKKKLARICSSAVVNSTPNIAEDNLELGPILEAKRSSITFVMKGQIASIMVPNATGGGEHELTRHALSQVAVMVHTHSNKLLVYIGRDATSLRTAVVLKIPNEVEFTDVVTDFIMNTKRNK